MKKGNFLNDIKNQINKSGNSKKSMVYFKSGNKVRLRFLQELDEGMKLTFHDSFDRGINALCQEALGSDCKYCGDSDLRTRDLYAWSVYNYDSNEVQILLGAANAFSFVPAIVGLYEAYGTITDRDIVITKNGTQMNISFSAVPMDKVAFKNKNAKAFSEEKMLKLISKAFPADEEDEDDDDETPRRKKQSSSKKRRDDDDDEDEAPRNKKRRKPVDEDEDDEDEEEPVKAKKKSSKYEDEDEDEDEEEDIDYEEMEPKDLYALCKKRGIDVPTKKSAAFYIKALEEDDEEAPW